MAGIVVKGFQGMQPTVDPKLLPESAAQVAENTRLTSGTVRSWKEPGDKKNLTLRTGETTVKTIYRYGQSEKDVNGGVAEDKYWFHFGNSRNIVKAPTYSTKERTYFTGADSVNAGDVYVHVTESDIAGTTGALPTASYRVGLPRPAGALSVVEVEPDPVAATWTWDAVTGIVTIVTATPHGYPVGTSVYVNLDTSYGGLAGERYVYVKNETTLEYKVPTAEVASVTSEELPGQWIHIDVTLYEAHNLVIGSTVIGSLVGATETAYKLTNKSFLVTGIKTLQYEVEDNTPITSAVSGGYLTVTTTTVPLVQGDRFKVGYNGGSDPLYAQYNGRYEVEVMTTSSFRFQVGGDEIESVSTIQTSSIWKVAITLKTEHLISVGDFFNVTLSGLKPEFLNGKSLRAKSTGTKTMEVDYPVFPKNTSASLTVESHNGVTIVLPVTGGIGYSSDLALQLPIRLMGGSGSFSGSADAVVYSRSTSPLTAVFWVGYNQYWYFDTSTGGFTRTGGFAVDDMPTLLKALHNIGQTGETLNGSPVWTATPLGQSTLDAISATTTVMFRIEASLGTNPRAGIDKPSLPTSTEGYWHFVPPPTATGGIVAQLAFPTGEQDANVRASANATPETRYYVWTYVNDFGEEGPPSLPSSPADIRPNWTAVVTGESTTTPTGYNIAKARLYRTATGSQATDYQYIEEFDVGSDIAVDYTDTKLQSALGEVLPSTTWDMPPPILVYNVDGSLKTEQVEKELFSEKAEQKLLGLSSMANGILAGYFDNTLCFSEPFQPFAWPIDYRKTLDFPITGMGAFGSSLFVGTTANPYIITGIDPAVMSMTKIETKQACVSARSVVEMGGGAIYASPDGLCVADGSGVRLVTASIIQRDDWQSYKPSSIHAAQLDGRYYAFYDNGTTQGCLILDLSGTGATLWKSTVYALASYQDPQRDALYLAQNVSGTYKVRAWDGGTNALTYTWRSKKFQLEKPSNFGAAQVLAKAYPVTFKLYADGTLKHTQTVSSSDPFRLPSGYVARDYEFELTGTNEVTGVFIANAMEELKRV